MKRDSIHLITVLCAVVEEGSFSRAAERLGINPPAISKAIAKLESEVGRKLLNRTTRKVEITDVGRMLYHEGGKLLLAWDVLMEQAATFSTQLKGSLTITCTPLVGESLVVPCLKGFKEQYPDLTPELILTNEVVKLPSQNIDIALRSSQNLEDSSLITKTLFYAQRHLAASPEYLASVGSVDHPDALYECNLLNFTHRKTLSEWAYTIEGKSAMVQCEPTIRCNSYAALKQLCLNGLGIARLMNYQIQTELASGTLVEVLPGYNWGSQTIHAVYHERMQASPKVKAFLEFMHKESALLSSNELASL